MCDEFVLKFDYVFLGEECILFLRIIWSEVINWFGEEDIIDSIFINIFF